MSSLETGRISINLTKKKKNALEASWSPIQQSQGFHNYCKSDEVQKAIPQLLLERERCHKEEAEATRVKYTPEEQFTAIHKVKLELWQKLTKGEKVSRKGLKEEGEEEEIELDE
jgi:hypothetical protein